MWWVMMLGMMLPSAAPMVLTFAALQRRKRGAARTLCADGDIRRGLPGRLGGIQSGSHHGAVGAAAARLLSPMLGLAGPMLGGVVFILAGIYQFTPLKNACLRQCRSPFAFVLNHWRDGWAGRCAWAPGMACIAWAAAGC